jgi:hypothetical protein
MEQIGADNVVEALSVQPVASVSVPIPDDKPTTWPYNALQKREEVCRPCRAATLCLAPTRARELQAVGLHVRRLVADSEEVAAMLWCTAGRRWRWRPCAALQRDPQPVVSVPITCAPLALKTLQRDPQPVVSVPITCATLALKTLQRDPQPVVSVSSGASV